MPLIHQATDLFMKTRSNVLELCFCLSHASCLAFVYSFYLLQPANHQYHPTEMACLKVTSDMFEVAVSSCATVLVVLTFQWHSTQSTILFFLHTLEHLHVTKVLISNWICSYLTDHYSFVKVGEPSFDVT